MTGGIKLTQFIEPDDKLLGASFDAFLSRLGGPALLHIKGQNSARCRVVVTLLHGNEPSGLKAIYRLLQSKVLPATDIKVIIGSVIAARTAPMFSNRMLPGQRDLNRCFNGPTNDLQGQLAKTIAAQVNETRPEAVIDVHNTSGSGPAFCVSICEQPDHVALASHFCRRLIHTDIRLGSIMEQDFGCPIITVEAGGAQDEEADENAYRGLLSYFVCDDVFTPLANVELLRHPRRLELKVGTTLNFADKDCEDFQITMSQDVEKHNFGVTQPSDILGWTEDSSLSCFKLDNHANQVSDFFHVDKGQLKTTQALKLFMVTTKIAIAKSDCLFYFVEDQ